MKNALLVSTFALSFALPAQAVNGVATLLANLKEPMEKLNDLSIQMQKDQASLQLGVTKLDGLAVMYTSLIEQEKDEKTRQLLEYTRQNFIECREMLDEDRQNNRFHFFNSGWNNQDDVSNDQGLNDEQQDEAFFGGITQDMANVLSLLK